MATTSTRPTVKAALIAGLTARANIAAAIAASTLSVTYAWEGVDRKEVIYLDPVDGPESQSTTRIPVLKAGRKPRQEDYNIVAVFRVAHALGEHDTAATTEARVYALLAELENLLADDPGLSAIVGPTGVIQVTGHTVTPPTPLDNGWMAEIRADINVQVRLS